MINFRRWRIATAGAILTMLAGSPHRVTERPEKVRAAAIRRVTLAGLAVILVGAGPVAAAMAAPKSLEPGKDRQPSPTMVEVRGRQLPIDDHGRYWMSGNLIGRWTVLTAETLPGYADSSWSPIATRSTTSCYELTRDLAIVVCASRMIQPKPATIVTRCSSPPGALGRTPAWSSPVSTAVAR
jgi:hypothetical protein